MPRIGRELALFPMWTYFVPMKTATVRDLRNDFAKLEAWLRIERRGQPIAMLTPVRPSARKKIKMPDFMARLRENWGDRVFSEEEVRAMREEELGDRG